MPRGSPARSHRPAMRSAPLALTPGRDGSFRFQGNSACHRSCGGVSSTGLQPDRSGSRQRPIPFTQGDVLVPASRSSQRTLPSSSVPPRRSDFHGLEAVSRADSEPLAQSGASCHSAQNRSDRTGFCRFHWFRGPQSAPTSCAGSNCPCAPGASQHPVVLFHVKQSPRSSRPSSATLHNPAPSNQESGCPPMSPSGGDGSEATYPQDVLWAPPPRALRLLAAPRRRTTARCLHRCTHGAQWQ